MSILMAAIAAATTITAITPRINWWLGQVTEQVHSQEDDNKLTLAVAPVEHNLPSWGWSGAVRTLTMVFSENIFFGEHIPKATDVFCAEHVKKGYGTSKWFMVDPREPDVFLSNLGLIWSTGEILCCR